MAARPLQPSEYEIQREVEALRDLRRRSTTLGALTIDPDLPNQSPPSSPTSHWSGKSPIPSIATFDTHSMDGFGESSSSSDGSSSASSSRGGIPDGPNNPADDPLHLFWVPASLHPEIAPAEFRAFLKEHARSPADGSDTASISSAPSSLSSSGSLNRKKSMLSRQYRPKENGGFEEENIVPLKRNRSLMYPTNPGPQLTISDLQMLEELAEEASESADPSRLRSVLRRSLSLNLSPSVIEMMDEMPEMGDEADAPIIVPPPGQILRRAARTKIRKPGLPGDGGGHRFGASRRGTAPKASPAQAEPRTSSEISSSDHGDVEPTVPPLRRHTLSDDGSPNIPRPDSYSEEASIYDAYARDDDDDIQYTPILVTPGSPSLTQEPSALPMEEPQIPIEVIPPSLENFTPILHQPQPQRLVVPQPPPEQVTPSRTPSPPEPVVERPIPVHSPPSLPPTTPSPPVSGRKEKSSKGGGLFKWGGDKGGKKGQKEKERESRERAEKEKESGFFGSLFGKKKQESEYQSSMTGGTSGRETAQALLGASKSSKSYVPPTSPGLAPGIGGNPFARYPIHVERAIYRLSHIKLANPRRPLYEQVLISNLMFWYLGVINKAQNPSPTPSPTTATNGAPSSGGSSEDDEQEEREKVQREKEQKEKETREKVEQERLEKEQREREMADQKKRESGKRGSLTKTPVGGQPGGRRAEMPIKGPQYEMQHRVMEQEYGGYNSGQTRSPTAPSPSQLNGGVGGGPPSQQGYPRAPQPGPYNNAAPKLVQPQPKAEQYYYQPSPENPHHRPGLPPGAMPPVEQQGGGGGWDGGRGIAGPKQSISPPPNQQRRHPSPDPGSHRRSRSPPTNNSHPHAHHHLHGPHAMPKQLVQLQKLNASQESLGIDRAGQQAQHRSPGRSQSATAYSSPAVPPVNGVLKKGNSAHAVTSYDKRPHTSEGRPSLVSAGGANGEEEDVPLAVWQQQRRK